METLIETLLEELYFPALPQAAAQEAGVSWAEAEPVLIFMQQEGLIRREDHAEEPFNEQTLLVATKKGLLRANGA